MSSPMSSMPPPVNPYQAAAPTPPSLPMQGREAFPTFVIVVMILDLVLLGLRALLVMAGSFALFLPVEDDPVMRTVWFELATGLAIVLFGVPANVGILLRQNWAPVLAYLKVAAVIASFGVGIWQATLMAQDAEGGEEMAGLLIGGGIAILIRVMFVSLYVAAVVRYTNWLKSEQAHLHTAW